MSMTSIPAGSPLAVKQQAAEGSKRDVEPKGMREGSKREEAFDRGVVSKQHHAPPPTHKHRHP